MEESELQAFYDSEIAPVAESMMEQRRKAARTAKTTALYSVVIAVLLSGIILGFQFSSLFFVPIAVLAVLVPLGVWMGCRPTNDDYKRKIVAKLIRFISPELSYDPAGMVGKERFQESSLFGAFDSYKGEDLIRGRYKNVELLCSELDVRERNTVTDSNGRTTTNEVEVFKGIFFVADFHKNFKFDTYVLPDTAEQFFGQLVGNFFQKCNLFQSGSLVRMEDPEFEKEFAVYSGDPIESRYLLSPKLMRQMLQLKRIFGGSVSFAFRRSLIYIALSTSYDFFKMPSGEIGYSSLKQTLRELETLLGIVEMLDLDVRIWSKE